jgi:hypothetical protein
MATPGMMPATYESVSAVGYKVADTRADLLVGQGNILKNAGDNTSAILRDANNNTQFTNANIERNSLAGMQESVRGTERLSSQANTVAWNEMAIQDAGFAAQRAQTERINDAQSAFSDRAAKFNAQMTSDSFARLSAQGELGFARSVDASVAGFRDTAAATAAHYASLSQQNCETKETVAAYGNRAADQTASVLHTLSGQHAEQTRDMSLIGRELTAQAANNATAIQLEAAKNAAAISLEAAKNAAAFSLEAAKNAAASQVQAALNAKDLSEKVAYNAKEGLLENSKWFALAEKTAMVNKCELESKLAACCCEIKESVIGTANATQSLIQSNESARVRDALSAAVAENSILRLRREERPYPVPYPYHHHHHESPRRGRSRSPERR